MMRTVHLHGEAGKLFGRKWRLDVETLAEAVRAIGVQVKGFQQYIEARNFQCIRGKRKGGMELDDQMVTLRLGKSDLHIIPVLQGAGGGKMGGIGKIIAGVLLAGFAFFAAPALGMASFGGMSIKSVGMLGIGLALSGVSSMLSAQKQDDGKDDKSNLFTNTPEMATQGSPVPLVVGEIRISDMPIISARIITEKVE